MSGVRYSRLASKLPRFHPLTENRVFAVKFKIGTIGNNSSLQKVV